MSAILVENLYKSYTKDLHVLQGLSFEVPNGSIVSLLGPNGAGKTTTIKILSTLLRADRGNAYVNGFDVKKHPKDVHRCIGLTGQYAAVDEYLSGRENLLLMGRLYHMSHRKTQTRVQQLLQDFDLLEAAERPVRTYSGGMKRRIDLAMSLIADPPVLFLDEPTTGLDPRSRLSLWQTIQDLARQGTSIFLTTQYMEEADYLSEHIFVLGNGAVIAEGSPEELKKQVGQEHIELRFMTAERAQQVAASLSLASDIPTGSVSSEQETVTIINKSNKIDKLKLILEHLEQMQVPIESLSLHKPTLDDVFLKFTGLNATDTSQKRML